MADKTTFRSRKIEPRLLLISGFVLAICLFYNYFYAFEAPLTGIAWNANWYVIDVNHCLDDIVSCEANQGNIQEGDQFRSIGDYTIEDFDSDRRLVPFSGYESGEEVPIGLIRGGQQVETTWFMPQATLIKQVEFLLTPILIYGPFWFVGSFVLLFMRPRDERWRILIFFSYITAMWIAIGLPSVSQVAYSSLFLHAISWLLIPVYIHLHLLIPSPLGGQKRHILIFILYIVTAIVAAAELMQVLPRLSYFSAVLVAGLGSIILLGYRSFLLPHSADQLASRLMLAGVSLALGPGIILFIVPTLLGVGAGQLAISLAILAIPILPLFYAYAIYKHQLGVQEPRINRFLASYTLFLVYLTVLGLTFFIVGRWLRLASELLVLGLIVALALILTALPLRDLAISVIDRLAYGTRYNKEEMLHFYASRIPAVNNRKELIQLIIEDLLPSLNIHQSALLSLNHEEKSLYYRVGVNTKLSTFTPQVIQDLSDRLNRYRPKPDSPLDPSFFGVDWVRLVVPLQARSDVIGLWLFGNRDPDDYYSKDDIDLLNTMARQIAITMENGRLFIAFQKELANKEQAEQNLARYTERLRLLHILDQAILAANSQQEISQVALDGIRQLVPCIRTSIVLFDHDKKQVEILAIHRSSNNSSPIPFQLPIDQFQDSIDLSDDRVWNFDELQQRAGRSPVIDELIADGVRTALNVPLVVANKPIGTLNVASHFDDAFSTEHIEIAREVANSVAVAIHNARLRSIITKHRRDLQQLSSRLIRVQEDERKRISYELHDEIGQVLTAVSFNLAAIKKECQDNHPSFEATEKLGDSISLVDHLTTQVRSLSLELRPTMLQDLGLIPTVRWYVSAFTKRRGIAVHFDTSKMNERFSEDVETTLYRIVQEALTNVSRHAEASQVLLCLERRDSVIRATIDDDGQGFQPEKILSSATLGEGVGLVAIRERVLALNGQFRIDSVPGEGTHLEIEIPVGDG